jgi:DNA-binding ferritin-like protein
MNAMHLAVEFKTHQALPGLVPRPRMRSAETGDLIAILNQGIAHAVDLRWRTKYVFWLAKDRGLYNLHATLREFCSELDAVAELMAARVDALGGVPQCTAAAVARNSRLPSHPPTRSGSFNLGDALIRSHHLAARHLIQATTKAMQQNDRVTASIFSSFSAVQQQQARFLKTFIPEQTALGGKPDGSLACA